MVMTDYAVAPRPGTREPPLILHRADCPLVRAQAEAGEPVMTLFDCEQNPDSKMPRCSCLRAQPMIEPVISIEPGLVDDGDGMEGVWWVRRYRPGPVRLRPELARGLTIAGPFVSQGEAALWLARRKAEPGALDRMLPRCPS